MFCLLCHWGQLTFCTLFRRRFPLRWGMWTETLAFWSVWRCLLDSRLQRRYANIFQIVRDRLGSVKNSAVIHSSLLLVLQVFWRLPVVFYQFTKWLIWPLLMFYNRSDWFNHLLGHLFGSYREGSTERLQKYRFYLLNLSLKKGMSQLLNCSQVYEKSDLYGKKREAVIKY